MMGCRKARQDNTTAANAATHSRGARGYSLHVGVNLVDPDHYNGWDGELLACEADAEEMATIAGNCGYSDISTLLTTSATRDAVMERIRTIAGAMTADDIFFLSYAGHGAQLPDRNGDEDDGTDETWCLHDGQLIDDELYALWHAFPAGSRILVVSDSCHSGSVTRAGPSGTIETVDTAEGATDPEKPRPRVMPARLASRVYHSHRAFYDERLSQAGTHETDSNPGASVRLLSGCQDNQQSLDGPFNGAFTTQLLKVWASGEYAQPYEPFLAAIKKQMPETQTPNHKLEGAHHAGFDAQRPFTV